MPRALDLFCCGGGAGYGYMLAGFDVLGVDLKRHRNYPGRMVVADALNVLGDLGDGVDLVHASPPCQAYSAARTMTSAAGKSYPDLLAPVRELLAGWRARTGGLTVIENVPGAPMRPDVHLCGTSFGARLPDGYELRRHRWFELGGFGCMSVPCDHRGPVLGIYGHGGGQRHRQGRYGDKATRAEAVALTGCHWMTVRELSQAIPPAYTRHIGEAARAALDLAS